MTVVDDNIEMAKMFADDQAIRHEIGERGWEKVKDDQAFLVRWQTEDAARLVATQKLLDVGALKSGLDFYRAAFIFQHGTRPENYLKAHHLAVIAISKGYDARLISAATLAAICTQRTKNKFTGRNFDQMNRVNLCENRWS